MKVSKWVDFGAEVDIDISVNDIAAAIGEAIQRVDGGSLDDEATRSDVLMAINKTAAFLKGMTDANLALLNYHQRKTISDFLASTAERFKPKEEQV